MRVVKERFRFGTTLTGERADDIEFSLIELLVFQKVYGDEALLRYLNHLACCLRPGVRP